MLWSCVAKGVRAKIPACSHSLFIRHWCLSEGTDWSLIISQMRYPAQWARCPQMNFGDIQSRLLPSFTITSSLPWIPPSSTRHTFASRLPYLSFVPDATELYAGSLGNKLLLILFYVYGCFAYIYVYTAGVLNPQTSEKQLDPLEQGLQWWLWTTTWDPNLCLLQEQKVVKNSCSEPHSRFSSLRSTTVKHGGQFSFSSSLTHYFSNNNECLWVRLLVLPPLFYPRLPSWGSYQLSQLLSVWLGSWFFLRYNSQWITWLVILSLLLFFLFTLLTHDWQMSRRNLLGADWEITYLIVLSLGK